MIDPLAAVRPRKSTRPSWNYVAAFAPRFADGLFDVGWEKSSRGFSFRIFSPGIGTGYSPVRHPRQMSSRECFNAVIRARARTGATSI